MKKILIKKRVWIIGSVVIFLIIVGGCNNLGTHTSPFTNPVSSDEPLPDILITELENYVGTKDKIGYRNQDYMTHPEFRL
jgi:hypothetical protein